jgi:hypothetical protein
VKAGVRGLFSKDCLNRGSVQNCGEVVVKPWHHRREAEGGRLCFYFAGSFQTGAPTTQGRAGAQSQLVATEKLHQPIIVALAPNAEFTIKMWVKKRSTEGTIWKGNAFVQAERVPEWGHRCLSATHFVADILWGTSSRLPFARNAI